MGVDVIAKSLVEPQLTDVAALGPYVDYVVLMTYDFHYVGSYIAGPVAPLKGAGIKREYDVESTIQEALKVLPAEKVIMGIPLYGYEWDTITNVPGGPTVQGTGKVLTHKQVGSILEECEEEETCITGVDEDYLQPYIIKPANDGNGDYYRQIFYEDRESMKQKLDIADRYNIRGVALWALGYEQDDMTDELRSYKLRMRK
jgi:spore germination protein YaaH